MKTYSPLLVVAGWLCLLTPAFAAVTLVSDSSALGANDSIDWASLGGAPQTVGNPFNIQSSGGVTATVSAGSTLGFARLEQGTSWNGCFGNGEAVLYSAPAHGPLVIDFSQAISGAGFQIQNNVGGTFTATLTAYDSSGAVLGSVFRADGVATTSGDDSAIFLGLFGSGVDITRLIISTGNSQPADLGANGFAIGGVLLVVPEPAIVQLGGWAAALALLFHRRGRRPQP